MRGGGFCVALVTTLCLTLPIRGDDTPPIVVDEEYTLEGDTKEAVWSAHAYSETDQNGKTIKFTLQDDWIGVDGTYGKGFGSGNGFLYGGAINAKFYKGTLIIDLNGHNIDRNLTVFKDNSYVISIGSGTTLIIMDSSTDDLSLQGKITGGRTDQKKTYASAVYLPNVSDVADSSKLILNGGQITGNNYGTPVVAGSNTCFEMNGGSIHSNGQISDISQSFFYALYDNNNVRNYGAGAYAGLDGSSFKMTGGKIYDNGYNRYTNHREYGASAINITLGKFEMSGGSITGNIPTKTGLIRLVQSTGVLSGGEIFGKSEGYNLVGETYTGGIYIENSDFTMIGGSIHDFNISNTATASTSGASAAVYIISTYNPYYASSSTFTMTGGEIYNNSYTNTYSYDQCQNAAGAIYLGYHTGSTKDKPLNFIMEGGSIYNNTVNLSGNTHSGTSSAGAIASYSSTTDLLGHNRRPTLFRITGGTITDNKNLRGNSKNDVGGISVNCDIEIGGNPKIYNNTNTKTSNDVVMHILKSTEYIPQYIVCKELTNGAYIGYTHREEMKTSAFTTGYKEHNGETDPNRFFFISYASGILDLTEDGEVCIGEHNLVITETEKADIWSTAVESSLARQGYTTLVSLEADWSADANIGLDWLATGFCYKDKWFEDKILYETYSSIYGYGKTGKSPFFNGMLVVPKGANIVLDLNGHKIDRTLLASDTYNQWGSVFYIAEGGTLTIIDSSEEKTGLITGGYSSRGAGIWNDGTLVVNNGNISGNKASITSVGYGGGIYSTGTLTMRGGNVENNTAKTGGGIHNDGVCSIESGTILNNNAESFGGGVYGHAGSFTLTGGRISTNTAQSGAGVYVTGGEYSFTNVIVENNTATQNGGGIYNDGGAIFASDIQVLNNQAENFGGGIYTSGGELLIGGRFNEAGIFILDNSTNIITGNIAGNSGGGIYKTYSPVSLGNVTIEENIAPNGGGFYDGGSAAHFSISGDITILNNYTDDTKTQQNNLQFNRNQTIWFVGDTPVTDGNNIQVHIGITPTNLGVFTKGLIAVGSELQSKTDEEKLAAVQNIFTLDNGDKYRFAVSGDEAAIKANAAEVVRPTLSGETFTYNQQLQELLSNVDAGLMDIEIMKDGSKIYPIDDVDLESLGIVCDFANGTISATLAGNYTFKFKPFEGVVWENTEEGELYELDITINKLAGDILWFINGEEKQYVEGKDVEVEYTGEEYTVTAFVKNGDDLIDVSAELSGIYQATDVNRYVISTEKLINYEVPVARFSWAIKRAEGEIHFFVDDKEYIAGHPIEYNGQEQVLTAKVMTKGGNEVDVSEHFQTGSITSAKDVGSYNASISTLDNFIISNIQMITWEIKQKQLTIEWLFDGETPSADRKTAYTGLDQVVSYNLNGVCEGEDVDLKLDGYNLTQKNAGIYSVRTLGLVGEDSANYKLSPSSFDWEITPVEVTIAWQLDNTAVNTTTYSGLDHNVTIQATGLVNNEELEINGDTTAKNVGSYTATLAENNNYTITGDTTFNWQITTVDVTIEWLLDSTAKSSVQYNKENHTVSIQATGLVNGETLELDGTIQERNVGDNYTATLVENTNYNIIGDKTFDWQITAIDVTIKWLLDGLENTNEVAYNGAMHNVTVELVGALEGDDLSINLTGDIEEINRQEGGYTVTANELVGTDAVNYNLVGENKTFNWDILQADITAKISVNTKKAVKTGEPIELVNWFSIDLVGLLGVDENKRVEDIFNVDKSMLEPVFYNTDDQEVEAVEPGNYTIKFRPKNENYAGLLTGGTRYNVTYEDSGVYGKLIIYETGKGLQFEFTSGYKFLGVEELEEFGNTNRYIRTYEELGILHGEDDLTYERVVIGQVGPKTSINSFVANINETQRNLVKIYNAAGTLVYDCGTAVGVNLDDAEMNAVGTGWKVELTDGSGNATDTVYISVLGDVDGDGHISAIDGSRIYSLILGEKNIEDLTLESELAVYISNSGYLSAIDAANLFSVILGETSIEQYYSMPVAQQ